MLLNTPNLITLSRIVLIPLIIGLYYLPDGWLTEHGRNAAATLVFILAATTDWLDGYLARRLNQMSAFGAFLDPVADKLMVAIALVLLVQSDPRVTVALTAAVIIGREITVSALREWMASIGERSNVAVSRGGKIKTTLQMVGIGLMVYREPTFGVDIYGVGFVLLLIAAGMTLWSMVVYLRAAWPSMMSNE